MGKLRLKRVESNSLKVILRVLVKSRMKTQILWISYLETSGNTRLYASEPLPSITFSLIFTRNTDRKTSISWPFNKIRIFKHIKHIQLRFFSSGKCRHHYFSLMEMPAAFISHNHIFLFGPLTYFLYLKYKHKNICADS